MMYKAATRVPLRRQAFRPALCRLCCLVSCLGSLLLAGCGPKDIGTGTADVLPQERPPVAETMRYPMTGSSSIQQRLYYMNRPAIMEQTQRWRMLQQENAMRRAVGLQPLREAAPPSPDVPRQRSPFRQ